MKASIGRTAASSRTATALLAVAIIASTALAQAPATPSPVVAALEKAVAPKTLRLRNSHIPASSCVRPP